MWIVLGMLGFVAMLAAVIAIVIGLILGIRRKQWKVLKYSSVTCIISVGVFILGAAMDGAFDESEGTDSSAAEQIPEVRSDVFEVKADLADGMLRVSLHSDLPEYAEIAVTVSRSYYEVQKSERYSHDYFSESSTVGQWKEPRSIRIDDSKWKESLREFQVELSRIGAGFDISSFGNSIDVVMVVHSNQEDPRFGEGNKNLAGKTVATNGTRVIKNEVKIDSPLVLSGSDNFADLKLGHLDLEVGAIYVLADDTPIMPDPDPADPVAALRQMMTAQGDLRFEVVGSRMVDGWKWYEVLVFDFDKDPSVNFYGWINSTALIGQDLRRASD